MSTSARLALTNVRINGRTGSLYVYDEHLVATTDTGERIIAMDAVERVATRKSWRGARLLIALENADVLEIRRLKASSAAVAHRTIIEIARARH